MPDHGEDAGIEAVAWLLEAVEREPRVDEGLEQFGKRDVVSAH